jgi:hypothetical protein
MNLDRLQVFPSQNADHRPTECVGYSICDVVGNIVNIQCDPGFSYAATLRVMGVSPETAGSDPYSGLLSAIVYGVLPLQNETFDASSTSELYEANLGNFSPIQRSLASLHAQKGIKLLESYQQVVDWLNSGQGGVVFPMIWYESFLNPNPDGTLPEPSGSTSKHCTALYETMPNGSFRQKAWLGSDFGLGGYDFISEDIFNKTTTGECWGIDTSASRWFSLATVSVMRPWIIKDTLPQMLKL